ncbi:DUF3397 family protein [Fructilactobacillus carniphilus]|uniref:DUF3397 domain-containing protein n=1 Tax=Fructilactobacillus carniphilus TaxID=2940297 RepID=A0ABY5BXU7_9LACO|nr:DUF3397 family protein [Fructilactobacillus carniphilus]USS90887.1 DUF3397 domain-containing protein [Fructilactobacillus carniphilus]
MHLVQVPNSISALLQLQLVPLVVFLVVALLLSFTKRVSHQRFFTKLKVIDVLPLFAIAVLPLFNIDAHGNTWLPLLLSIWFGSGALLLVIWFFKDGEILLKPFLIAWWRLGDLYWLACYVIALIYEIGIRL